MSHWRSNRVMTLWESADTARKGLVPLVHRLGGILLALSLVTTVRIWSRPREVIRIGCDGIPQVVRIDEHAYSEPDDREIRAFAAQFAVFYMRADSYSIVNDYVWAAARMTTELRDSFKREARGAIAEVQALKRRTQVRAEALEIAVDKKPFPWRASVKGVRQTLGEEGREEPFDSGHRTRPDGPDAREPLRSSRLALHDEWPASQPRGATVTWRSFRRATPPR